MSERCTPGDVRTVHVGAESRSYDVSVGSGVLDGLGDVAAKSGVSRACLVTETNVGPLYADRAEASLLRAGIDVAERIVFPAGEQSKTLATLGGILEELAERGLTRDDAVIALGGGVTGDMGGLAAALYLRGIKVVQVPTSLLAMVDSSVGGKTAVDLPAGKNLVGAFWQPCAVVADVACLRTVPRELFTDSCGEVIKHAVLSDPTMLDELTQSPLNATDVDDERLVDVVTRNVQIKRDVVSADELERGLRQTLNLGHTIGHAIESASGLSLGHGSCVAAGLCMVARASARLGWSDEDTASRIVRCVAAHGLPTGSDLSPEALMSYVAHDKKRHGDAVNLVVPEKIGRAVVRRVTLDELERVVRLGEEGSDL